MDLFNVLYWSYDDGRYTDWGSVYPPLNFVILRFVDFLFSGVGYGSPEFMRDNSQSVMMLVGFIYFTTPAILLKMSYWRQFSIHEKILIYFLIILSAPMLFALERGNLILLSPIFLAIAIGKIGVARSISIAVLVNIKPYFAILFIYYIARRNWRGLITCLIGSGVIFAISGLWLDNNFLNFFENLFNFSKDVEIFSLREVMSFPSSISAFSYMLNNPGGAAYASSFFDPFSIEFISNLINLVKWVVLTTAIAVLIMRSWEMRDSEILTLIILFISNLGVWVGGYTLIFYVVLVPILINLKAKRIYIILISMLAIPLDFIALEGASIGGQYSYLTDSYNDIQWTLGLGSIVRPVANLSILLLISIEFFSRRKKGISCNESRYDAPYKSAA